MTAAFMPGPRNAITDVDGILVGQAQDEALLTGVSVISCVDSVAAAVDVRGGGPGTRETEALLAENLVHKAHAVVLTGGSVFGLAAADAVTWAMSQQGQGLKLTPDARAIPIVPAAVLHDLTSGTHARWQDAPPYAGLGKDAVAHLSADVAQGSVGAGIGARAGLERGGIGTASLALGDGIMVGALMAANPVGSVRMADDDTFHAWPLELNEEFGGKRPDAATMLPLAQPDFRKLAAAGKAQAGGNTTIGVVATTAALTASECKRLAIMAHDGLARAVSPAHTHFDGDTIFAISTGTAALPDDEMRPLTVAHIGAALADCTARAIAKGVYHASKTGSANG
ncbi:MAG: P1 family peptidase [Pseudomonadota bacterium]